MKRILYSLLITGLVGGAVFGATSAFFSDTETSTDNTVVAGKIDLQIDSTAHYDGLTCKGNDQDSYFWVEDVAGASPRQDLVDQPCTGSWETTDLDGQRFFDLTDLKPGDWGENTISLHVDNNDAWGQISLVTAQSLENGCTEPEIADEPSCAIDSGSGELDDDMMAMVWLDQGETPGFQGPSDSTEGDNIYQPATEPYITEDISGTPSYALSGILSQAYSEASGDQTTLNNDGLYADGRIKGATTYYLGVSWCYGEITNGECDGSNVNNRSQSDKLVSDIVFEVEQYRNNPHPFGT